MMRLNAGASVYRLKQVESRGILHPIKYMLARGLVCGSVLGTSYGVLLTLFSPVSPVLGSFIGAFIGSLAGLPTGIALGLVIHVISVSSLRFRSIWAISGMTGFGVMIIGAILYLYLRSLDSNRALFNGIAVVPMVVIPALIAAFCSAYVSNKYAKLYLEQHDESDQSE
jgi:hypothetical protein